MKMQIRHARLLLLSLLFLTACGKKEAPREHMQPPAAPAKSRVELIEPGHGASETIAFDEKGVAITYYSGGATLAGAERPNAARRYEMGEVVAADVVQNNDESFKLKSSSGDLLWKVKLADDKIKVSDNEENAHPYVLRREDGYVKVKDDEKEIGRVRFSGDTAQVIDSSGKVARSVAGKESAAYGVLLMSRVPYPQRMIIMAELLARER